MQGLAKIFYLSSVHLFKSFHIYCCIGIRQVYRINDLVVIELDEGSFDHSWTWKAKVIEFFVH